MKKPARVMEIFLQPGEFYFGDENTRIRTLLGSCVAITLWHPARRIGGMCHFMLPTRVGEPADALDGRYADEAIQLFQREIRSQRTAVRDYQVKLFGGGHMFQVPPRCADQMRCSNVACRNVLAARALLKDQRLHVAAEHVGQRGHRNVIFDVWSGDVWLRHVKNPALRKQSEHDESGSCLHRR